MTGTINPEAASVPGPRLFNGTGDVEVAAEPEGEDVAGVAARRSERARERLAKLGPLAAAVLVAAVLGGVAAAERWASRPADRRTQPRRSLAFMPGTGPVPASPSTTPVPSGPVPAGGRATPPVRLVLVSTDPGESPGVGAMPEFDGVDDPATFSGYERDLAEEALKARLQGVAGADPEPTPPPAEEASSRLASAAKTLIRTVSDAAGGPPR